MESKNGVEGGEGGGGGGGEISTTGDPLRFGVFLRCVTLNRETFHFMLPQGKISCFSLNAGGVICFENLSHQHYMISLRLPL